MAAVMGRVQSPQADAIRDLYRNECATAMRRTALADGRIRVALFREGAGNQPVSIWHVYLDGRAVQVEIEVYA